MISITVTNDNFDSINWEGGCFKYCVFEKFEIEGKHIDRDFIDCTFTDIDWYWGLFNLVNFVGCKFNNCTFRGSSFPECKFVECEFHNCNFIKDNLNGDCSFENARAYNCVANSCSGLNIPIWLTNSSSGRAKGARR